MAKIPGGQERVVFSGASIPGGQAVQQSRSPIANALRAWAANEQERTNQQALENVQQAATRAQQAANLVETATGLRPLAEAPDDTTGVFRDAFEQQARAVFSADLTNDATRELGRLAREHPDDPQVMGQKFNSYMSGQLKPLMEADAVAGEAIKQKLDAMGLAVQDKIASTAAAQARENARTAAAVSLQSLVSNARDVVQAAGSEDALIEQLDIVNAEADNLRAVGELTNQAWLETKQRAKLDLTRDMYFGQMSQLLDAPTPGSIRSANALIAHAESGIDFDDNDQGRALASQLATKMKQRLQSGQAKVEGQVAAAKNLVNGGLNFLQATGRAPENPAIDNAMMFLAQSDNVNDRLFVQQARNMYASGDIIAALNTASWEQLNNLDTEKWVGQIPNERLTALLEYRESRMQELLEAGRGDPMSLMDQAAAETPDVGFDWWADKRGDVAGMTGRDLNEINYYSRDWAEGTVADYNEALDRERPDEALAVIQEYFPADKIPKTEIAAIAMQHNLPELGSAGMMWAINGEDGTRFLLSQTAAGRAVTGQTRRSDALLDAPTEKIRELADTLSMGSTQVREQIIDDLNNAFIGIATTADIQDSDEAQDAVGGLSAKERFNNLIDDMRRRDTLDNGQRVPKGIFTPDQLEEVNRVLGDDAVEFFGDVAAQAEFTNNLIPVPGADGSVFFKSATRPGVFVGQQTDEGKTEPFKLAVEAPSLEAQVRTGFNVEGEMLARTGSLPGLKMNMAFLELPLLAQTAGADEQTMRALFMAAQGTPQRQISVDQNFTAGFHEDNVALLDLPEYDRLWEQINPLPMSVGFSSPPFIPPPVPNPWNSADGSMLAASMILAELEQQFDDPRQIMLAYVVGADTVREAGDDWRSLITGNVATFMGRVEGVINE